MNFNILDSWGNYSIGSKNTVFLTWDNWNDFGFYTVFGIFYVDHNSIKHELGGVHIGFYGQKEGERVMKIGIGFSQIADDFFSLGTSEEYYSKLNLLPTDIRDQILNGLNDIAKNNAIFNRVKTEEVYYISFLRSISPITITGQFHRLANGGVALTPFSFSYAIAHEAGRLPMKVEFEVKPESFPPTNVHVIIGRNSSGKTFLINQMMNAILEDDLIGDRNGFEIRSEEGEFANVISLSFSAFDDIEIRSEKMEFFNEIKYTYIGLRTKKVLQDGSEVMTFKTFDELANEFANTIYLIKSRSLDQRWTRSIMGLYSDPNFAVQEIHQLIEIAEEEKGKDTLISRFKELSSGHKIVLLSVTRLVEALQEKTLVFLDEPELHLHPPLLAAFIRSISDMLINLNGVAIIATHSPVILQEVPGSCVWKLRRPGTITIAERLAFETFGENVGVLSADVFSLEVENTGFYKLLTDKLKEVGYDYEKLLDAFDGQLGLEARSIAIAYINARKGS